MDGSTWKDLWTTLSNQLLRRRKAHVFPARVVKLKDGAHGHGELPAAVLALPEARTVGLALEGVVLAYCTAMGASRAAGPPLGRDGRRCHHGSAWH